MLLSLLAALQAGSWTAAPPAPYVGDTVVIQRLVPAGPRVSVRVEALAAGDDLVPLSPPQVMPRPDGALVRYTLALFRTGPVVVRLPAVTLVHPDSGSRRLPPDSVLVRVASVLPAAAAPDTLGPRGSQAPVARPLVRQERFFLPVAAVLLLTGAWVAWRRRPRRVVPGPVSHPPEPPAPPGRWLAAGEPRVAAAWGIARLRQVGCEAVPDAHDALDLPAWRAVVRVHRPDWPHRRMDEVLERLDRARFAPLGAADVDELLMEVEELVGELEGGELKGVEREGVER